MDVSVLICTYNRERLLAQTLDSLARVEAPPGLSCEVLVVDNNSTDGTRRIVESRFAGFPAPLRYSFEGRQGKAHALNTGIAAAAGRIIAFLDDDVRVHREWLEAGVRPLIERTDIDYTGGPAYPMWEAPPPAWVLGDPGRLWGPIALVDYGPDEFIFEERRRIPLGVNMAVRRTLIERVGGFHVAFERKGTSLMGQGQAEFFFRTRAAGARGLYVPRMAVEHLVPASRMTRSYYRRWWYWKGVARALMQDLHPVTELGIDIRNARLIANTPPFIWRSAVRYAKAWLRAAAAGNRVGRAEAESKLAYYAGYIRTRATRKRIGSSVDSRPPAAAPPATVPQRPKALSSDATRKSEL